MPFTVAQRVALSAHEKFWQYKLALRLVLLVLAIVALGLLVSVAAAVNSFGTSYAFYFVDIYVTCALGFCILWALISIPYLIIRKKPVHPGWNVGVDLIAWLALGIAAGSALAAGAVAISSYDYLNDDYSSYGYCDNGYGYGYHSGCDRPNEPSESRKKSLSIMQLVGGIFAAIVVLLEFTLFVWACVDCQKHNQHLRDVQVSEMTSRVLADMRARGQIPADYPSMEQQRQNVPLLVVPEPAMTPAAGGNVQYGNGQFTNPQYANAQQHNGQYGDAQHANPQQADNQYANFPHRDGPPQTPQPQSAVSSNSVPLEEPHPGSHPAYRPYEVQ